MQAKYTLSYFCNIRKFLLNIFFMKTSVQNILDGMPKVSTIPLIQEYSSANNIVLLRYSHVT